MTQRDLWRQAFREWFSGLPTYSSTGGLPARGSIAAGLVVLEHLREEFDLSLDAHRATGKAQIRGLTPSALKRILERFGETRPFLGEGGRTNRGGPADVESMLRALRELGTQTMNPKVRLTCLDLFQEFLVDKVREYHSQKRLALVYDPAKTTSRAIHELLEEAGKVGKRGPVAQYLVGAKLQMRFPNTSISNDGYSSPDEQSGRIGDFQVGDTAFHVTISPTLGVFERCRKNLENGARVYLLVPEDRLVGTRQNAEQTAPGSIAVESLESFIANNIDEISQFAKGDIASGFRHLLELYNQRVDSVEVDKSMLIDIPATLR